MDRSGYYVIQLSDIFRENVVILKLHSIQKFSGLTSQQTPWWNSNSTCKSCYFCDLILALDFAELTTFSVLMEFRSPSYMLRDRRLFMLYPFYFAEEIRPTIYDLFTHLKWLFLFTSIWYSYQREREREQHNLILLDYVTVKYASTLVFSAKNKHLFCVLSKLSKRTKIAKGKHFANS